MPPLRDRVAGAGADLPLHHADVAALELHEKSLAHVGVARQRRHGRGFQNTGFHILWRVVQNLTPGKALCRPVLEITEIVAHLCDVQLRAQACVACLFPLHKVFQVPPARRVHGVPCLCLCDHQLAGLPRRGIDGYLGRRRGLFLQIAQRRRHGIQSVHFDSQVSRVIGYSAHCRVLSMEMRYTPASSSQLRMVYDRCRFVPLSRTRCLPTFGFGP